MAVFQQDPALISGYLSDESGLPGQAEGICFPRSGEEVGQALALARLEGKSLTVQGARTGYEGRAVPQGGYLLNLSRLNRFLSFQYGPDASASITLQSGVTLEALDQLLQAKDPGVSWPDPASAGSWRRYVDSPSVLFFPPNPTEGSATLGGVLATGANGSHVQGYGELSAQVPDVQRLPLAGGTVITACTLKLAVRPPCVYLLLAFAPSYARLLDFLGRLEGRLAGGEARLDGAEFFDPSCFRLAREYRGRLSALGQIPVPPPACAGLCLELSAGGEEALFPVLEAALELMEEAGLPAEAALAAMTPRDCLRFQRIRHLITEAANSLTFGRPRFLVDLTHPDPRSPAWPRLLEDLSATLAAAPFPGCLLGHLGAGRCQLRLLPAEGQEALAAGLLVGIVPPEG